MWKYPGNLFIGVQITARWLLFNKYICALILMIASIHLSRASVFSQEVIEAAAAEGLLNFSDDLQNAPMNQARAIYFMAVVVQQDPAATYGSEKLVRNRLLEQFRSLLTPGSEPNANGSLAGWTHSSIAHAFLLAKKTSSVWSHLTNEEKNKIDWLMKAMAVAGHFCFDDDNDFRTGLGNEGNFYKLSNPNYMEGYVGCVIAASLYFGADALNTIFKDFKYAGYINQFGPANLNFPNILSRWNSYAWGPVLENGGNDSKGGKGAGIRNTFTYLGVGLDDLFGIYKKLADVMYGVGPFYGNNPWTQSPIVIDGLTVGGVAYSWTLNNGSSPYLGQPGMCYEFHASDGSGANTKPRSHINYVSDGWGNSICTRASLEVLGYWKGQADSVAKVETRTFVGSEDFLYKAGMGFRGYSSGSAKGDLYEADLISVRGHAYPREIWQSYLKKKVVTSNDKLQFFNVLTQTGVFAAEFDVVPNSNHINGSIGITKGEVAVISDMACVVRFYTNGFIEVKSGDNYVTSTIGYSFGKRYHFRLEINVLNHKYDVYVKPEGEPEALLGKDFSFSNEQASVSQLTGWSLVNAGNVSGTVRVSNMKFAPSSYTHNPVFNTAVKGIRIYPNPLGNEKRLSVKFDNTNNIPEKVIITDILGQTIHNDLMNGDGEVTFLPNITLPGIYTVSITSNSRLYSKKLIVR